jgi:hypothetical protein
VGYASLETPKVRGNVMEVSPNALRKETVQVLNQVNAQIGEVTAAAHRRGCEPEALRDEHGNWPMIQLLLAKSQCVNTLTLLSEQGKRR